MNLAPRFFNVATFCCVAGCNHIFPFIAGAITNFAFEFSASAMQLNASSAKPWASLAMVCAVAGAMSSKSAASASSIGEILTVGAYCAYLVQQHGGGVILSGLAAAAGGGALALAVHNGVVDRFVRKGIGGLPTFIATLGVSLVIQNVLVIIFGASNLGYAVPQSAPRTIGPFLWTDTEIQIMISAVVITALLYVIIQHTRFGKSLRAVSQNRSLASVSGINAHRVASLTWLLAGVIAGYAGFILAESIGTFSPYSGFTFFLITLTAAVAGSCDGSVRGPVGGCVSRWDRHRLNSDRKLRHRYLQATDDCRALAGCRWQSPAGEKGTGERD